MTDFPTPDTELTHILVVEDLERTRRWYTDVLGATVPVVPRPVQRSTA